MFRSLYSIVDPLLQARETGVLRIRHAYGGAGKLFLRNGRVEGVEASGLYRDPAVRELVTWVTFSTAFTPVDFITDSQTVHLGTAGLLALLGRVEKAVKEIAKVIPGNEAIFQTVAGGLRGERSFTREELQIALSLDGTAPVRRIVAESDLTELTVLHTIKKFFDTGLIKKIPAAEVLIPA